MVFWVAVLIGGLFAWAAAQVGFFASWIMLFNLVLSAYLAIFVGPLIVDSIPATTDTAYGYALVLLTVGIATLVTSYAICYACLSGRLRVEFPHLMDKIGAGILGFLGGFLVSSFLGFAVSLTPLPEMDSLKSLGLDAGSQRATRSYICWWCDVLHGFVGSSDSGVTSEEVVASLLERVAPPPEQVYQPGSSPPPAERKTGASQAPVAQKGSTPDTQKWKAADPYKAPVQQDSTKALDTRKRDESYNAPADRKAGPTTRFP